MSISFTYCGVACGVLSIDNKFYIGIDPDLSPKGTLVQFKGFVSEKQTNVNHDKSLLNKVDVWLITHGHHDHLDDVGRGYLKGKTVISPNKKILDGVSCLNNIYFTGDTIFYSNLTKSVPKNIDAIFANLGAVKSDSFGGPFTMDLKMLNQMNDLLQPKNIYPIHIEDYSHYNTTNKEVEAAKYKVLSIGEIIDI